MCGRFTLHTEPGTIAAQFALFDLRPFEPRYNIAPTQNVPVVRLAQDVAVPARRLDWLRWGLVPGWADDPSIGNRMINARADKAAEKPAFRAAFRHRRCLVVADGFYEWHTVGRRKQPYYIQLRDGRPFAFAGLWEVWEGSANSSLETCTLLTTDANELLRPIHDRMPVILPESAYELWLDPAVQEPDRLKPLLVPYPSEEMSLCPVSSRVNKAEFDSPECIAEVNEGLF